MGIQGLLPLLKSIMVPIHIKDLEGSSVAVDTYSWLHKGALSCSSDLCKSLPTSKHIDYCMHRVNLLRHYGIKPILVFDGGLLPMKIEQENKRARSRKENLARAVEHELNGNSSAAYECYQKAVDISPSIAYGLIRVLKRENISYIVAPYEADAQMTFLAVTKQVDAVITEDSDLIPFGCPRIIFKMDKYGQGVEFKYSTLQQNRDLSFSGFTKQMLLEMCILSGCDYLPSLPGMGLKRAHALIKKFTSYSNVIKHLRYSTVSVPPLYEESLKRAILTFQHQRVYDPIAGDIVHLFEITENIGDDLDFLGPFIPQHIAKGIAEGDLDPFTKVPFQEEKCISGAELEGTLQQQNISPGSIKKKLDLPVQKNVLTKYFCFASLEAKRKFKAPQKSPKDIASLDPNHLPGCIDYSEKEGDIISESNLVRDEFNIDASHSYDLISHDENFSLGPKVFMEEIVGEKKCTENIILQQSTHLVHKPCIRTHKERECNEISDATERKTRTEIRKVIVRSSYFKHKPESANDKENKQEKVLHDDHPAIDVYTKTVSERKTGTENRKVIVRSPYFKHKPESENDKENKREKSLHDDHPAIDMYKKTVSESASAERNSFHSSLAKRKISPSNDIQLAQENTKLKLMHSDKFPLDKGFSVPENEDEVVDTNNEEAKFGSKISHIGKYSDIAERSMEKYISEKSVERFVSKISSFRYSSSGSRASGLRAPLKDVRNICPNQ